VRIATKYWLTRSSKESFSSSVIATCPVSGSVGETLKDIRAFTRKFGVVTSIKAYWDRNKPRPAEDALYAVMPSMGVNLVDCSSIQGYTNDALIKMLSGEGACTILMSYHSKYAQWTLLCRLWMIPLLQEPPNTTLS